MPWGWDVHQQISYRIKPGSLIRVPEIIRLLLVESTMTFRCLMLTRASPCDLAISSTIYLLRRDFYYNIMFMKYVYLNPKDSQYHSLNNQTVSFYFRKMSREHSMFNCHVLHSNATTGRSPSTHSQELRRQGSVAHACTLFLPITLCSQVFYLLLTPQKITQIVMHHPTP